MAQNIIVMSREPQKKYSHYVVTNLIIIKQIFLSLLILKVNKLLFHYRICTNILSYNDE